MVGRVVRYLPASIQNALRRWRSSYRSWSAGRTAPTEYWTKHHVAAPPDGFASVADSLRHFAWRNAVNPGHIELMPVDDVTGKTVLDYGCGPGNDVIGFGHYSKPAKIFACDVSPTALTLARRRAALHGLEVDFRQITDEPVPLPFVTASVDVIHSAGVLHHTSDPLWILREFRRVLRPDGEVRVMVYNRQSLWMHLYVSYVLMIQQGLYRGMTPDEAFPRTTDGEACPIARCYRSTEFIALAGSAGLKSEFLGASITLTELEMAPQRWSALADARLPDEARDFLYSLTLNDRGWPLSQGTVAGVNAYFRLRP